MDTILIGTAILALLAAMVILLALVTVAWHGTGRRYELALMGILAATAAMLAAALVFHTKMGAN